MLEVATIWPWPTWLKYLIAILDKLTTGNTFKSNASRSTASSISSHTARCERPALLTRISSYKYN